MDDISLSDALESRLALRLPPVALAFVDTPPPGVPRTEAVEQLEAHYRSKATRLSAA